jgi:hypothetical protein
MCGELVEPIKELDPSIDPDDQPYYNLLCPNCGFMFRTQTVTGSPVQIRKASPDSPAS